MDRAQPQTKHTEQMKQTVNKYQFTDAMINHGFSYDGANALFEWLEEYEESTGNELDFDPIGLRCEFNEYESLDGLKEDYPDLEEHTTVIDFGSGYIVGVF